MYQAVLLMNTQVGQVHFHQEDKEMNPKTANYIRRLIFKLWNQSTGGKEGGKETGIKSKRLEFIRTLLSEDGIHRGRQVEPNGAPYSKTYTVQRSRARSRSLTKAPPTSFTVKECSEGENRTTATSAKLLTSLALWFPDQ